ncbi:MAG TPA: hypothetical protein VNJ11_02195 [Bryobacteraceae bacterium]|nr:hypothetical protein [Bryobacteraceae bacterium]
MRAARITLAIVAVLQLGESATLERLSLDELIEKSTAVVRGRVYSPRAYVHGPVIYTRWTVQVMERWKGPEAQQLEVVVPGGVAMGLRQTFSGAPKLQEGGEYVLFLWTGRNGLTHVVGLSQGVFAVSKEEAGGEMAWRAASTAAMVDPKSGRVITDEAVRLRLADLRARVAAISRGAQEGR